MKFRFLMPILLLSTVSGGSVHCLKQIRIAVIDTGLDLTDYRFKDHLCKTGHKNFVDGETISDNEGHGTFVAGLIEKYAGDSNYCMLIYKYYQEFASGTINQNRENMAIKEAIKNKADIINFSGGGPSFNNTEALLIEKNPKIIFVVAAGNESHDIDSPGYEYFPASLFYPNMEVVENVDKYGELAPRSNYSKRIKHKEMGQDVTSYLPGDKEGTMSGTSMSTAIFSGKLVAKTSKTCNYR
jgi:major intracellular serine protease